MAKKGKQKDPATADVAMADMPMIDAGDESGGSFSYSLGGPLQIETGDKEDEEFSEGGVLLSEYADLEEGETAESVTKKTKTVAADDEDEDGAPRGGRDAFLEGYVAANDGGWDPAYE